MAGKASEKNAMSVINEHIEAREFAPFYLFTGEEEYLVNQYKDKLLSAVCDTSDTMNFLKLVGDKFDCLDIIEFCETMPFFAHRRVVLAEDTGFFKKSMEDFPDRLKELPDTALVIFVEKEVDKRNKLYNTVKKCGQVLEFEMQDKRTLAIWVKSLFKAENVSISDDAIYGVIDAVGQDMNTLKNEVQKLISYSLSKNGLTIEDVNQVCVHNVEGKIFEMIEAIAYKNQKKVLALYHDLLANREPAMRVLYLITRQYDMLLKTKLCMMEKMNQPDVAKIIGTPPWAVKKYIDQCRNYNEKELVDILEQCQSIDEKLKTGQVEDVVAVESLIITLSM